jgi:SAM-dependent methyltransferase
MRLDIGDLHRPFAAAQRGRKSRHAPADRTSPSIWLYDYLTLHTLNADIVTLLGELPTPPSAARALDVGTDKCPYRDLLAARGYRVETLDIAPGPGVDHVGSAEDTGLPDGSYALVLCTQVLEHTRQPWQAMREMRRLLAPGGALLFSAPHVWFFHPHPADNWRFTQEGMLRLCAEGDLEPVALLGQGGTLLTVGQVVNFLLYGLLGRWGAPLYGVINVVVGGLDRLLPNELFCHNFAGLAVRRADGAGATASPG